jgi:hypothetical protein
MGGQIQYLLWLNNAVYSCQTQGLHAVHSCVFINSAQAVNSPLTPTDVNPQWIFTRA